MCLSFVEKLTNSLHLYAHMHFSRSFFLRRRRRRRLLCRVCADRKHINSRPHNDVSNDYYYNSYDIQPLFSLSLSLSLCSSILFPR